MFGDGRAGYVLFFYFNLALGKCRRPQYFLLCVVKYRSAGTFKRGIGSVSVLRAAQSQRYV